MSGERIPQSTTLRVPLQAYLSTDHVTPATGKTIAITISKNGGAYGNPSGGVTNAVEIASGSYYVDLSTTDTGTGGPLYVRGTASGVDDVVALYDVVNQYNAGFGALPNVAAEAAGGIYTRGSGAGQINQAANGQIDVNKVKVNNHAVTDTTSGVEDVNAKNIGNVAQTGGDIYPAVQNIAVTSAALNITASSRSITTGSGSGGVANTTAADLVYDNVSDATGTLDFYYEFNVSGTNRAVGVGVGWLGYVVGLVNTVKVYAFNWGGASWDQIGTVVGIAGTINQAEEWELTSAHTGTGGNLGLVRIRFSNTGLTSATVKTDRILLGYVVTPTGDVNVATWASTPVVIGTGGKPSVELDGTQTFDQVGNITGNLSGSVGSVAGNVSGNVNGSVGSVIGSVGSVLGNLGGNVVGSVGSVLAGVSLTAGAVQTIWDALTSALITSGSIGKLLVDGMTNVSTLLSRVTGSVALQSDVSTIEADLSNLSSRLPATLTMDGNMKVDVLKINGSTPHNLAATDIVTNGAIQTGSGAVQHVVLTDTITTYTGNTPQTGDNFLYASRTIGRATVAGSGPGPTTTAFTVSTITPSGVDADQFKGRIIIFDNNTTTAALRGQATAILGNSSGALPVFTVTALTRAPVAGDTFSIV